MANVAPQIALIEYRLAVEFNYRMNIIVPNISWGILEVGHECDLLILRPSGYAAEIEIKRSLQDLKADAKKAHAHDSKIIRELWFCVADDWPKEEVEVLVPKRAGIVTYSCDENCHILRWRYPEMNKCAQKFNEFQRYKLLHLAHMRIWKMKNQLARTKA